MPKKLIQWLGLTGILSLLSYTAAVLFAPFFYPGYDWMAQAVSDLSAETAPSRMAWEQLATLYNTCSVVCTTCVSVYISEHRISTKLFRVGVYLFTLMNWISRVGYQMFALSDAGKDIAGVQEVMHMVVTACVVVLSIVSLVLLIIAGCRGRNVRAVGIWAAVLIVSVFLDQYLNVIACAIGLTAVKLSIIIGSFLIKD